MLQIKAAQVKLDKRMIEEKFSWYIWYRLDTTSHMLGIFRRVTSACQARVKQTYFSTLTARRSRYSATI